MIMRWTLEDRVMSAMGGRWTGAKKYFCPGTKRLFGTGMGVVGRQRGPVFSRVWRSSRATYPTVPKSAFHIRLKTRIWPRDRGNHAVCT